MIDSALSSNKGSRARRVFKIESLILIEIDVHLIFGFVKFVIKIIIEKKET